MFHNRPMKLLLIGITTIALTVLLASPARTSAQGTDPASVIEAYIVAVNAGNLDAALALFGDDATMALANGNSFHGKVEITLSLKPLIGGEGHLEVLGTPQVSGDRVTFIENVTFAGEHFKQNAEAVVQNGKITSLTETVFEESATATPAPTTAPTTGGSYAALSTVWLAFMAGSLLIALGWLARRQSSRS